MSSAPDTPETGTDSLTRTEQRLIAKQLHLAELLDQFADLPTDHPHYQDRRDLVMAEMKAVAHRLERLPQQPKQYEQQQTNNATRRARRTMTLVLLGPLSAGVLACAAGLFVTWSALHALALLVVTVAGVIFGRWATADAGPDCGAAVAPHSYSTRVRLGYQ